MEGIPQVKEIALDAVSAFSGGRVDPVYPPFVCAAVAVWLIMFCHMWSLRRTLSRVFFVASQMQSQMDSVKWQVDAVKKQCGCGDSPHGSCNDRHPKLVWVHAVLQW